MMSLRAGVRGLGVAASIAVLSGLTGTSSQAATPAPTWWERGTKMVPHFQWNANDGYCGETAFISAGMRFGQYTSQWTARALATPGVPQWKSGSQLLLGVNDLRAAKAMRLDARAWNHDEQKSAPQFLAWVKKRVLSGDSVIMGVFNNTRILNEWNQGDQGDSSYDHIVPVFGVGSAQPLRKGAYSGTDTITISDNGLHTIGQNIPYLYTYTFDSFLRTRAQANAVGGPIYSLRSTPKNFGVAVRGIIDTDGVTVPVRLISNVDGEGVQNQPVMKQPPAPMPITLTARVKLPDPSRAYRVYLYDDFAKVPGHNFNAKSERAMRVWTIPAGGSHLWSVTIHAMTSDTRVFRAVPVSAP